MASSKYFPMLKLRGKWWSYRKRVPQHLRGLFRGRREIVVSLRTQDEGEARVRVLAIAHETEKALQRAREKHRTLAVDPNAMAKDWHRDFLREDQEYRVQHPYDADGYRGRFSLEGEIYALEDAVEDHRAALQKGDTKIVQSVLNEVLDRHKVYLTQEVEKQLAHALLREGSAALETVLNRARGQWRDEPQPQPSPLVSQALEAWLRERKPPSKTEHEVRATFKRFLGVLKGGDKPIAGVTKEDVRSFRTSLLGESAKVGKGIGTLAPATIRKYMNLLGTVFRWAVRTGLLDSSPATGMSYVAQSKTQGIERQRQPFTVEAVRDFFASPLYSGCGSKVRRTVPGPNVYRDSMWWVGLILFHSGMRLEEVGGLRGRDVQEREGVPGFSIEPSEGRSLKTATATRFVPLHPVLVSAGLVELANEREDKWLFDLIPDRHGKRTANLSKTYGRYLRTLKLDSGGRVVMHSARHTVADRLRAAGVPEDVRDYLLGHAGGGTGRRYGTSHPVATLQKAVAGIEYPGVKLVSGSIRLRQLE